MKARRGEIWVMVRKMSWLVYLHCFHGEQSGWFPLNFEKNHETNETNNDFRLHEFSLSLTVKMHEIDKKNKQPWYHI